jgi:hypothetical protein
MVLVGWTLASIVPAQDSIQRIKGAFDLFTTDELGHVYALQGDVLSLFAPAYKVRRSTCRATASRR